MSFIGGFFSFTLIFFDLIKEIILTYRKFNQKG